MADVSEDGDLVIFDDEIKVYPGGVPGAAGASPAFVRGRGRGGAGRVAQRKGAAAKLPCIVFAHAIQLCPS